MADDYLIKVWGSRENVRELQRQYKVMAAQCPWVMRDLGILCHAESSAVNPGNIHETLLESGKREVWLHMQAMIKATEADIEHVPPAEETGQESAPPGGFDLPRPELYEEDHDGDGNG